MPFLTIYTNAGAGNDAVVSDAAELVAKSLSKPLRYVVINLQYNPMMAFDGSVQNKGALLEMKSIGFNNKTALASALTDFVVERLGAERGLVNIEFVDMPANTVAIGGSLLG